MFIFNIMCDFYISPFQLSNKYWAPHAKNKLPFDPKVSYLHFCNLEVLVQLLLVVTNHQGFWQTV